jgi:hypothetical protein
MKISKNNPTYMTFRGTLSGCDIVKPYTQAEKSWANAGGLVIYSPKYILGDLSVLNGGRKTNKRFQLMLNNDDQTILQKYRSIKEAFIYIEKHSK